MSEPIPPIGTQISALAALAPDEPAVTCDGRDPHPRRARPFDESVGPRVRRAWRGRRGLRDHGAAELGRVDPGRGGVLEAGRGPPAVVRAIARRRVAGPAGAAATGSAGGPRASRVRQCSKGFRTRPGAVRRRVTGGGVAGVEGDGIRRQHRAPQADRIRRRQPDTVGHRLSTGRPGGRHHPGAGAAVAQHRLHHRDDGVADAPSPGADEPVRPARVSPPDRRPSRHVPDDGADDHAADAAGLPGRPGCLRPVLDPAVLASGRAVPAGHQAGVDRPAGRRRKCGNSTAAPNYRR